MMTGVRTERPPAFSETATPVGLVVLDEPLKVSGDMVVRL